MNRRERILTLLSGGQPDRIPWNGDLDWWMRAERFNHDLAPGAMIVEVGTAGNTLAQAMASVPVLAQAIIALAHGANPADMA